MGKKRTLSNDVSNTNIEDFGGKSKYKKIENNSDLATTRKEMQDEGQTGNSVSDSTTHNVHIENDSQLEVNKFKNEKKVLEETISNLNADLLMSRERHKVLGQARLTVARKLAEALDDLKVEKRKTEDQEEITDILKLEVKSLTLRLEGKGTPVGDSDLYERLSKMHEDMDKNT